MAFIFVFALKAAFIIIMNTFTFFVFKTQTGLDLKRNCLFLINLAVPDLLIRAGEVVVLEIHRIARTDIRSLTVWWSVQAFGLYVSVMLLAVLSLKRVYAVFWPLRHRVTSARAYIFSIVTVWVTGLCITGPSWLAIYHADVDTIYAIATADVLFFISLLIISASYQAVRSRLNASKRALEDGQSRLTGYPNLRLSRTFSVVVAV